MDFASLVMRSIFNINALNYMIRQMKGAFVGMTPK